MLAWIYEAGNKVVTGVGLSLVPYLEENGGLFTLNIPVARRGGDLISEQRRQRDGAAAFHRQ